MRAMISFARRRYDRMRQFFVVAHAVGKNKAIHPPLAFFVHGEQRGRRRSGEVTAYDDLDLHHVELAADDDIRIGIMENMVGTDIFGLLEPKARDLRQRLPLEWDRGD